MARDPREDPATIWLAVESYQTNAPDGSPRTIIRGARHHGGPGSAPALHPQWWIEDGATDDEIGRAREQAGVVVY
jgi:hypothetical protein